MTDRRVVWDRVAALTGAVFVGLTVVGFGIAGDPGIELDTEARAASYDPGLRSVTANFASP